MTNRERFAQDYGMPLEDVHTLVQMSRKSGDANTHACNGDVHPRYSGVTDDKNLHSTIWEQEVTYWDELIRLRVTPYGFTEVTHTGLGPTLKRGDLFVEIPY